MCTQNRTLSANMHFMLSKKASNEPQFLTRKKREIQLNKKKSIKANVSKRNNAFSHSCRIENNWLERRAKRMKRMEWIFYPFRPSNVGIWQCSRSNSCHFQMYTCNCFISKPSNAHSNCNSIGCTTRSHTAHFSQPASQWIFRIVTASNNTWCSCHQ